MKVHICLSLAAALLALGATALGGDVNPPAGPIAPTGFTLAEIQAQLDAIQVQGTAASGKLFAIEPGTPIENLPQASGVDFVISEPGRYFLSADWFGDGTNDAIEIRASNVEIDLRGFSIVGGSFSNAYAIDTIGGVDNVTVRNGSIVTFGGSSGGGIRLNGENCVLEDVRVMISQGTGVSVGSNANIKRCIVFGTVAGFAIGDGSSVRDCAAASVASYGFLIDGASSVENCTADSCGGDGFDAGEGTILSGCVATRNGGAGFSCFGAVLTTCTSYLNTGDGFAAAFSKITTCHATENSAVGFDLAAGNNVNRCSAVDNGLGGFLIGGVRNHVASNHSALHLNGGYGYRVTASATDCFVVSNFGEANSSFYDFQTTNGALGTRRINLTGASIWDNFSQ